MGALVIRVRIDELTLMSSESPTYAPIEGQIAEGVLLDHLYEAVPVGLCVLDSNLHYVRLNDPWSEISGQPASAHLGRHPSEVATEVGGALAALAERVLSEGTSTISGEISSGTTGERLWSVSLYPVTTDGRITAISGIAKEMTEHRRARAALAESEERYRDVVDNTQGLICIHDLSGNFISLNDAAARSLGYEPQELIGRNLADVLAPSVQEMLPEYLSRIQKDGVDAGYMRAVAGNGEERIWTYRNVLRQREGQEPYVIGLAIDISDQMKAEKTLRKTLDLLESRVAERTQDLAQANSALKAEIVERKKAQRALRASEEEMRQLLETTNVIPWEADAQTWRFTYVGPQAVRLLGYPLEVWYEDDFWAEKIHPDDRDEALEFCLQQSQLCRHYEFEYRMLAADGRIVWIHDIVSVEVADGEPVRLRGFMIDMTNRKQAEEDARRLRERMARVASLTTMGEMAAGIAHEINQPLTAIATYGQACQRLFNAGSADDEQVQDTIATIVDEALRAGEIIHRLKDLLRRRSSHRSGCDLNELISEVAQLAGADARWKNLELRLDLAADVPEVVGDGVQLQQVILNLIRNGVEAMEKGGEDGGVVVVGTGSTDGGEVTVSVADAGIGVPADLEDKVFQPFFTTKESGLGLGLSLSNSIIRSHGGRLWFSRNAAAGTTFYFTLPAADGDSQAVR